MTWKILQGDVLDRLRDLPDESVQCCVTSPPSHTDSVESASYPRDLCHGISVLLRALRATDMPTPTSNTGSFRCLLDISKAQAVLRLRTLDPKEWKDRPKDCGGFLIGDLPGEQRPSFLRTRLADVAGSAEQRREEVHRLRLNLLYADPLAVVRLTTVAVSHRVGGHLHTDGSIGIDHARAVSEVLNLVRHAPKSR